ncbi:MAG: Ig-like domain-containing protein [Leptospiraceae bacterium]|nr:Ig-like domain-containing protein [Leptospiraceae bacterium]
MLNKYLRQIRFSFIKRTMFSLKLLTVFVILNPTFSFCLKAKKSAFDTSNPTSFLAFNFISSSLAANEKLIISSTSPKADETNVSIVDSFTVTFSTTIDQKSISSSTVSLLDTSTNQSMALEFTSSESTLTISHSPLQLGRTYRLTIKGGDSGVFSQKANKLSSDFSFSFTTGTATNLSGGNGLNFNVNQIARSPNLVVHNSKLYAFWSEIDPTFYQVKGREITFTSSNPSVISNSSGAVNENFVYPMVFNSNLYLYYSFGTINRFTKFNSNLNWTVPTNLVTCSNPSKIISPEFRIISQNSDLYLIQDESNCIASRVVRVYQSTNSGTSWSSIVGPVDSSSINPSGNSDHNLPDIIYFNSNLYATYVDGCDANCSVKFTRYLGTSTWSTPITISDSTSNVSDFPAYLSRMFIFNNKLYIVYTQVISGVSRLRVKVFNGSTSSPAWTAVDNSTGINFDLSKKATRQFPFIYKSNLYIIWSELNSSLNSVIRLKSYNGNDSAPVWTVLDGGGENGLNVYANRGAFDPAVIEFNGKVYGVWSETGTTSNVFLSQLPL